MLSTPHPTARGVARPAFLLLPVLALLALASFPTFAQADSGGAQYETAVPKPTGGHEETPTRSNDVTAGSSKDDGGTSGGSPSGAGDSGSDDSSSGGASGNKNGSTGGGDGKGQSSQGKGSISDQHAAAPGDSESNEAGFAPTGSQSDDGGSSPLVPILIAIVLLAAVSVGIVYYRQRRGGAGAPASSPKAG